MRNTIEEHTRHEIISYFSSSSSYTMAAEAKEVLCSFWLSSLLWRDSYGAYF